MADELQFALRFIDGRGVLDLAAGTRFDLVGVDKLELEVPNLRFPFDASGGAARFQSRRCNLAAAELRVDGERLQAWLDGRGLLARLGISGLRARLAPGRIALTAEARVGDRQAPVTASVTLAPGGGQRLILRIDDVRAYAYLPAPAPLVGLGVALGLGALRGSDAALCLRGSGEIALNPLELLLWNTLPPSGWRLPRYRSAALIEARVDEDGIVLRYATRRDAAEAMPDSDVDARAADALLSRGDLAAAADAYAQLARERDTPEPAERQLAILSALPARWNEAQLLGARLHAQHPERPQPLLALAQIEAERGLSATAAARYARLAQLAEAAGESEDARLAQLRAGELYTVTSPREAVPFLEKTLAADRGSARAAALLSDAYGAEARWQDLLRLERWRLTQLTDAQDEVAGRARMARVWLDELDDAVRARDELERALRPAAASDLASSEVWQLYARALEATGDNKRAREALSRAAGKLQGADRAALELRAARLAEGDGSPAALEAALAHARAALTASPTWSDALARNASLLARLGRLDEAVQAYQEAIERADEAADDSARAALLVDLARLARAALHDHHGARAYVERALAISPSPDALQLAAELATEDGRLDDLESILGQLAAGGDRLARLRQAETLLALERFASAAAAAQEVTTTFAERAWTVLARAGEALGQTGELREALEHLAALEGPGRLAARLRLADSCAREGDLEGARRLLEATLAGPANEPEERQTLEALTDVLLRQGDDAALDGALGRLSELRSDPAGRARALSLQGASRARMGRLPDALASYRAALKLAPADDDAQARAGLGEAAHALKLWDDARSALEPLFTRGLPPRIERALRLGEIAERQGKADEAVPFYQSALEAEASAADAIRAYNALAAIHHARGDFEGEAEIQLRAADDPRTNEPDSLRAGRTVAAADLLRRRVGRVEDATRGYERALQLDPLQLGALDSLEALATEAGDPERVAQVLGRKVAATAKRPNDQRAILGRLAALQAELGRPDAARAAWSRALELDPAFRAALVWLAADARARNAADEEMALLTRLTALPGDPVEPEALPGDLARLAQLHLAAGQVNDAERSARRALELHGRDRRALAVLDELYSAGGRTGELVPLLALRAEVETDFDLIVDLLFRRASLLESTGDRRGAQAAYEQLIALRPSSAGAWNRLAQLLREAGEWQALAQHLTRLAERHALDGRRSEAESLYVEVAHLCHDRMNDPERARAVLHKALEVEPRSRVAITSLLALARGRGDAVEEDALLGRLGELADDASTRALALTERARARHARGDLDGALALLREIPPAEATDATLKLRVEIEEARGTFERPGDGRVASGDAVAALEQLRSRAAAAHDVTAERWATRRMLRVAWANRAGAAEELARRLLVLDGDDRDAATVLAEIERARGNDGAHLAALERLLRIARRTFEGPARECELGVAVASVLAKMGDLDGAKTRLRDVLELSPDDGAAHRVNGELLLAAGATADAARSLGRAAELGALDGAGWVLLGSAYEALGDVERASSAYQYAGDAAPAKKRAEAAFRAGRLTDARNAAIEALRHDPRDPDALAWATHGLSGAAMLALVDELTPGIAAADAAEMLFDLAPRLGGDEERLALERAVSLHPTANALVALADRLRGAQAATRYEEALAHDPGCWPAALGLAREGEPYAAARALQGAAERAGSPAERAELHAARARLLRDRLGDAAGARSAVERALDEAAGIAELSALRADLLRMLATLCRAAGDGPAAEFALETLVSDGSASDADLRHLGELFGERAAHAAVIALLSPLPGSSEVLERALEAEGRIEELVTRLDKEAARKPASEAHALLVRAAQLAADKLADPARAAELYERTIPLGPADAEVWARLGKLYWGPLGDRDAGARCLARAYAADRERTDVLLPLGDFHHDAGEWEPSTDYYRQALSRFAVPADEAARVYLRLAEHAGARDDTADEEEALLAAITLGADSAWTRLTELYRARGDGMKLAQSLLKRADNESGAARASLLREAVPHVSPAEAARLDEQILLLDDSDDGARDRVLSRLRAAGDTAALIERLERELPRAAAEPRAAYAHELGRLAARVGDDVRAERAWRAALAEAPSLESARGLYDLLARHNRHADAGPLLEAGLDDPRLAADDRGELARLVSRAYLAPGADTARALTFLERAQALQLPISVDAAAWRQLLRAERRYLDLVVAIDNAAMQATSPEERLRLELEAAETLERDLGHSGDAARRYAALFDKLPTRRDLAARARSAYSAANEPIYALTILDRELKLVEHIPADAAQLKIARGELLLQAGADAEAEAEFLHALITTPRIGRAHAALADVYKKRGDLAGALEHLIAAADAPDLEPMRAAACAVDAADVLLVEGDSITAERLYQLAAALDPADRRPVDALARLAGARGDHERHADLLGRAAALTADRRERARLALQRAKLFQVDLKRDVDAYRSYKEAVACDPNLREAVRGLREMAEARGEWALGAEQRYRELSVITDGRERARLHVELGRALEEKLLDGPAALRNYEQAAELILDGNVLEDVPLLPWADLVRLYGEAQRWREAALAAERWAATLTGSARAEALSRAGELHERGGDHESARRRLAEAAAIGGEAGRKADDNLLRMAEDGDPEELRRRIEERLAIEPEGELRLDLLRRLLAVAVQLGDAAEIDARSQEILARAPDDSAAFVQRKHALESSHDAAGLAQLLRARAGAIADAAEKAERRFEAGRIAESELNDVAAAANDYEAALAADADHVAALDALADLSYRTRHLARARALYAELGERPSALGADEVWRRRGELAEESGELDEARTAYGHAVDVNASNLLGHQALARLALARGDDAAGYHASRAVLDLLPLDAVERITELRRHLGELAVKLGDLDAARHYFELVLAQLPMEARALDSLARIYLEQQSWQEAADTLGRLSRLVHDPAQRAELLWRRGEVLRLGLNDFDGANDAYLKAADLHPVHAPTLRRLVSYYFHEGDYAAVRDVARELEGLGHALDESAPEAGLGIALGGDEARGTVVVAVARPSAARLAELLTAARITAVAQLDPALRTSVRALGNGGRASLLGALEELLGMGGRVATGARLALARLHDLESAGKPADEARARIYYSVHAFVDPAGLGAERLRELPPPPPLTVDPAELVHPSARGSLRDALTALAPLVLGLPPSAIEADPSPQWSDKLRPLLDHVTQGELTGLHAAVVLELPDPAWAEPTRPPRLLLARRALADEAVARFAAARAAYALLAGVPLVEGRPADDVAALLRAAAALFLPDMRAPSGAFVKAWQAELSALSLNPDELPEDRRAKLEMVLANVILDSSAVAAADDYAYVERLSAGRAAFAVTGDLRAALVALAPTDAATVEVRAAALGHPELADLVAFALACAAK